MRGLEGASDMGVGWGDAAGIFIGRRESGREAERDKEDGQRWAFIRRR